MILKTDFVEQNSVEQNFMVQNSAVRKVERIRVLDSHTAGEPTRLVLDGGPPLGSGPLSQRLARFRREFDGFRSAVVEEPRGSDVLVGALLVEPHDPRSTAGVIFFNNVGYLGMCGHGIIGVVTTLAYLGKIDCGEHTLETPVGSVQATLHEDGAVTVANVRSFRARKDQTLTVPGYGKVCGDVAWGGNWFFLVEHENPLRLEEIDEHTRFCRAIRLALAEQGVTGSDGSEIDHIELFTAPLDPQAHSRNFVLCPGNAYDRSPCGTGTSAKMACLYADGKLAPGQIWRQEGILGTVFEGSLEAAPNADPNAKPGANPDANPGVNQEASASSPSAPSILPRITGRAWVTAESTLLLDPTDPFRLGIRR